MQKTKKVRNNCLFLENSDEKQDNESVTRENLKLWIFQLCIGLARTGHTLYICLDRVVIMAVLFLVQSRARLTLTGPVTKSKTLWMEVKRKDNISDLTGCIFTKVISFCTSFNSQFELGMPTSLPEETCLLQLTVSPHRLHINGKVKRFTFFFYKTSKNWIKHRI